METPEKHQKHGGGAIVGCFLLDSSTADLLVCSLSMSNMQNYR